MGIIASSLGKLGLPGVESFAQDKVLEKFFKEGEINKFENFHVAFIDLCNEVNTIFPGKHYKAPRRDDEKLKEFFESWKTGQDKDDLIRFIKENIKEHELNEKAMIITGLVAPTAATVLKNAGENTPQLKKFRLHLVPNFVFVPTFTFLAIFGVKGLLFKPTTGRS